MPLIARAVESMGARIDLLNRSIGSKSSPDTEAQVGALTSWLALLVAAEVTRQETASPDLDRGSSWVRWQLDSALTKLRAKHTAGDLGMELGGQQAARPLLSPSAAESSPSSLRSWLVMWVSRRMRIPETHVDPSGSFADYGLDSVAAVELAKALSDRLGRPFDDTLLWNFPTIDSLIEHIAAPASGVASKRAASSRIIPISPEPSEADELELELARLEKELRRRG
jgi:acyl carrier protein